MTKLRSPLFSIDAHGRVGQDLLFTTGKTGKLAKKNPVPTGPRTWPQIYHRWLYQDYALLWTEIPQATRDTWNALAAGTTRSGFNLFMQDRLTTLPDIAAWWHLDGIGGAAAPDSSLNGNHGTITGSQAVPFIFNNGLLSDGLTDRIDVPHSTSLNIGNDDVYTVETIVRFETLPDSAFFSKYDDFGPLYYPFYLATFGAYFFFLVKDTAGNTIQFYGYPYALKTPYRIALVREQTLVRFYINGFEVANVTNPLILDCSNPNPIYFATTAFYFSNVTSDETIIWTRALSPAAILMHAERK